MRTLRAVAVMAASSTEPACICSTPMLSPSCAVCAPMAPCWPGCAESTTPSYAYPSSPSARSRPGSCASEISAQTERTRSQRLERTTLALLPARGQRDELRRIGIQPEPLTRAHRIARTQHKLEGRCNGEISLSRAFHRSQRWSASRWQAPAPLIQQNSDTIGHD